MTRVLIVEDDDELAASVGDALEAEGFEIAISRDGYEALGRLRREMREAPRSLPDVIVLDLMMPNMDGFGFRKRQLEEPELAGIPVIVSSCVGERTIEKMSGVAGILRKPYDLEQLVRAVKSVVA